jgi:uncharacterized damage-inducible protein DinB
MTPAERAARIESYGSAHDQLQAALRQFPKEMWHFKAAHDPWSIHEIVVHITDSEANSYIRARRGIAEPGSVVLAYDENGWAAVLHYADQSTDDALELFKWLRRHTYTLIQTLPDAAWANTMDHPENGLMTLDDWLHVYDRHIPDHIAQMQRIHAAWLAQQ